MASQIKETELSSSYTEVQTLVNLGLTVLQAKVYITLAKSGTSTGRTTAKLAQVAPQDVYRVLTELQEKGLVEKIITRPAMYRATAFKESISILLQHKKEEYIEIEKQVKIMAKNFSENKNQDVLPEKLQFSIFSEYALIEKTLEKLADMAKNSIDIAVPLKMNKKTIFYDWPFMKRAARRGVKIRIITKKTNGESSSRNPKSHSEDPLFEVRYLPEIGIPFGIHIFDKQEVMFSLSEKPIPGLRTDNPTVIKLAEVYFENIWNNAQTN